MPPLTEAVAPTIFRLGDVSSPDLDNRAPATTAEGRQAGTTDCQDPIWSQGSPARTIFPRATHLTTVKSESGPIHLESEQEVSDYLCDNGGAFRCTMVDVRGHSLSVKDHFQACVPDLLRQRSVGGCFSSVELGGGPMIIRLRFSVGAPGEVDPVGVEAAGEHRRRA